MVNPMYAAAHQKARKAYAANLPLSCVFCGRAIHPGEPFDLDHLPGTQQYRGVAHPACNRRDGAIRGNRQRGQRRRRSPMGLWLRGMCVGLDLARDRRRTAVAMAGYADHPEAGEVLAAKLVMLPGVATAQQVAAVWGDTVPALLAVNGSGHLRVLSEPLKLVCQQVHEAGTQDMADAHGRLLDELHAHRLRLPDPAPELSEAVQFARSRALTDGSALDKRGAERDLAPLVALELAVWSVLRGAGQGEPWAVWM